MFLPSALPKSKIVFFFKISGQKKFNSFKIFWSLDQQDQVNVSAMFSYHEYPVNPNGSDFSVAALSSQDGRHLAIMPHIERSLFPWNWPHYPTGEKQKHEVGPWIEAFTNARDWIKKIEPRRNSFG
jgi:phosphoribosylformylglycinamidine synthase